jgi:hypothetical protein
MKTFLKKILFATLLPGLFYVIVFIFYRTYDVYQDFGTYPNYSWKYEFQSLGDLSTKKLINSKKNYNTSKNYNTFIFGSSRTTSLFACYVQNQLEDSKAFHFGNWNESIGGILEKIKLLDSLHYQLSNIMIYIDTDYTFEGDGRCKPYDHYLLTHAPRPTYLMNHFSSFLSNKENYKILLGGAPPKDRFPNRHSDPVTNDPYHKCTDSTVRSYGFDPFIRADSLKIDSLKKSGFFYARSKRQKYLDEQISSSESKIIDGIVKILNRHRAKLYVIITPLYDQRKFNPEDISILRTAFGESLYDFSGINAITNNEYNYKPDRKHFREVVSKKIFDSIIAPSERLAQGNQ